MTDLEAIETVVQTYLDGLYEGSVEKLKSCFHPTAALTQVLDGEYRILTQDAWWEMVHARPSPKSQGFPRHDHILQIDQTGPTMAYVKVKCAVPPRFFTDQLNLLKVDGRWVVAQKVYMTEVAP
jgi:hypothetical protein